MTGKRPPATTQDPPATTQDPPEHLHAWCLRHLVDHDAAVQRDPLATGVRQLAIDLHTRLDPAVNGLEALSGLVKHIGDKALHDRAARLAATAPACDWRAMIARALSPYANADVADLRPVVEARRVGVVFTAHPTFALSRAMREALCRIAGDPSSDADLASLPHAPDPHVTLDYELEDVHAAIGRAQDGLRDLSGALYDWLSANAKGEWWTLRPAPILLSTWVGYDLDGRTDIHWAETIRIRLEEKAAQLSEYADMLAAVRAPTLAPLTDRLIRAAAESAAQAALFSGDLDDPDRIVAAANRLTAESPDRITSLTPVIEEINAAIASETDTARRRALFILRAEMDATGLGVASVQLRVNAAQVRSAIQNELGLSAAADFFDRRAVAAAADRAAAARAQPVNFGAIFEEKMTARRQMMLSAEILKHIDEDTPIRFLIAESESPATIMGAVYLARVYGVDHKLDISPLFETPEVLDRGGRFMERLLDEPEYLAYVRQRGRLCVQYGFSDSGRFMGQLAADMAIERLHVLLSRAMAARGVHDVAAVIFNTHGESMGRGAFPGTMEERLDHVLTPWVRARFAHDDVPVHAEVSFQGGDGYLHFGTPALAGNTLCAIAEWAFNVPSGKIDDAFYKDINFSWDIYRGVQTWQEQLFDDPHYQAVLGSFGPNLLPVTGSRKTRRQSGTSATDAARSLRAIPHNAILQQLAAPANVSGGVGLVASREPERFLAHVDGSPRLGRLLRMAAAARNLTSLSILRTYANLYDPAFWTIRAARSADQDTTDCALRIAERLDRKNLDVSIDRLANFLSSDRRRFDAVCNEITRAAQGDSGFPPDLYVLHAARMTLIIHAFSLAGAIPQFSARHDVTRDDLIDMALELRFADVADILAEVFPAVPDTPAAFGRLTEKGAPASEERGYPRIVREITQPLHAIDRLIKEITVAICHAYGAFG
ncbi:MAG: phosphoenolpyruvate carboxylase [Hyphomonadaceae bacterium]